MMSMMTSVKSLEEVGVKGIKKVLTISRRKTSRWKPKLTQPQPLISRIQVWNKMGAKAIFIILIEGNHFYLTVLILQLSLI